MTWTATVTGDPRPLGALFESSVQFANDADSTQNFSGSIRYASPDDLTAQAAAIVAAMSADPTPVAHGTVLDVSPPADDSQSAQPSQLGQSQPAIIQPSQADLAREAWVVAYQAYRIYATGLALGLPDYDSGTSATMLAAIRQTWDPSYAPQLSAV